MDLKSFLEDAQKGGGQFADWRDDGKIVIFLHLKTKFKKRKLIRVPVVKEDDQGVEQAWTIRRFHMGDEDAAAKFIKFLRDNEKIPMKQVVLEIKAGDKVEQWRKGDLLKVNGFDWKKNILQPRTEYMFDIVRAKKPKESEIMVLPFTAGKKIAKLIDDEIEELGDEGDPTTNPWAIQVTFDEKASGSDMYSVRRSNLPYTEAVAEVMTHEPNDVTYYCDPASDDEADGSTFTLLSKACVIDCPFLEVDQATEEPEDEAPEPAAKPRTAAKPKTVTKPKVTKPTATKPKVTKPTATKPKATPPKRPSKPSEPVVKKPDPEPEDTDGITVSDCQVGVSYIHDEEVLVFGELKGKHGFFFDQDDIKVKVPKDEVVQPFEAEADSEPEDSEAPTGLTVRDLGPEHKGEFFYDSEGNHLKFIRYNDAREKGVFQDKEEERVFLDGDEIVSGDAADDTDAALEPVDAEDADKEVPTSEEPEAAEGDADGSETFECPKCKGAVGETDPECPHCGIEFTNEGEDGDGTPFDED